MGKITYADKVALNEVPSIADINKCKASDMNEIKNVVNTLLNDISSSTAPQNPVLNDLWVDTNDGEYLAQVDDAVSTTSTNAVQNQAITNYVNGTVLYNDTSGGATGNIVLSDSAANYRFLEIIYTDNDGYVPPAANFYNCNNKRIIIYEIHTQYVKYKEFTISGTNMNIVSGSAGQVQINGSTISGNNYIKILTVIGHK